MRRIAYLSATVLCAFAAPGAPVDYIKDVKPVLAEHCYRCHGASQQKAGLRLDTAALAAKGGDNGPAFKPSRPAGSLMVQVIKGTHPDIARMPYKKPPLSETQIALVEAWIAAGAVGPADEKMETAKHWAFVPPQRPALPKVRNETWARDAIDYFVLQRLEKEKLQPAPEADRITLIRRLSFDLIGLPPTTAEVDAFLSDNSPIAYERLVERLLQSPHYGERWGRHWLDVARYADSNGYSIDAPRSIWKYRDWVIAALNRDMPFDQFAIEQLAGDLLPSPTFAQRIATGFHRNTQINQEGGIDPEQFRVESVLDRVNTTGTAFLGLTIGCAQCHDHKFDPLTQREYYQLYAFFNQTVNDGHGGTPGGVLEIAGELDSAESTQKERMEAEEELERYLNTKGSVLSEWENGLPDEQRKKLKAPISKAMQVPFDKRTPQQKRTVYTAFLEWGQKLADEQRKTLKESVNAPQASSDKSTAEQKRKVYAAFVADDPEFKSRNAKLLKLEKGPKPVTTLVMQEISKPRRSFLFVKGDFTRDGGDVSPGVPAVLQALRIANESEGKDHLPNRLDLAKWIVDLANPLTARVIVNRIWQQYFGRGIVETENDFGTQGALPTHPELLDWLATELMTEKWSLKAIHRLIVNSATYRQSSRVRPELQVMDPNNKLLARQSRLRLDAEVVRDVALAASGLLSEKIGGPPVFPPQPDGVMNLGQVKRSWTPSLGADRYRRGVYTHFWRATPHPALAVFDASDGFSACTRRLRSNTPLQALTLLNDSAFYEFADALAAGTLNAPFKRDGDRIEWAFRRCLARTPNATEKERLLELLKQQRAAEQGKAGERNAWTTVARVLLNLDETITRE